MSSENHNNNDDNNNDDDDDNMLHADETTAAAAILVAMSSSSHRHHHATPSSRKKSSSSSTPPSKTNRRFVNQRELCEMRCITPAEARRLPHRIVPRRTSSSSSSHNNNTSRSSSSSSSTSSSKNNNTLGGYTRIFDLDVVSRIIDTVHGDERETASRRIAREASANAVAEWRQTPEYAARERVMRAALHSVGVHARDDSITQQEYLDKTSDHSLDDVVHKAAYMHYLHTYTNYADVLETTVQERVREMRGHQYYPGIYRDTARAVQARPDFAAPDMWPWLLNNDNNNL